MNWKTNRSAVLGLASLILLGCNEKAPNTPTNSSNFVVDAGTVCRCAGGDVNTDPCAFSTELWRHTTEDLLGVSAFDFDQSDVGKKCEGEVLITDEWPPLFFNAWVPATGKKVNMAGTLSYFNWDDSDDDWNLHVIPNPPFTYLIEGVENVRPGSRPKHDLCGGPKCMEAEISPDQAFWNNPWFFGRGRHPSDIDKNGFSILEAHDGLDGKQMGYYGLWVMDERHKGKAEIHPASQMWWKEHWENGFGSYQHPFDVYWLLFLQDNTGRFDDYDDFDCEGLIGDNIPAGWKPWENSPRAGQWNLAFEVNPQTEVVTFTINESFSRYVVTKSDPVVSADADDGTEHVLEYQGRAVVKVNEMQPVDEDLGVTFTHLCLRPNGKLAGMVTLKSRVGGDDDEGKEGFQILNVTKTMTSTAPLTVPKPPRVDLDPTVRGHELPGSLGGTLSGFQGDFGLAIEADSGANPKDLDIASVALVAGNKTQAMTISPSTNGTGKIVSKVPLLRGAQLEVTAASGRKLSLNVPALVLSPFMLDKPGPGKADPDAWTGFLAAVGGEEGAKLPNSKQFLAFKETGVRLAPLYLEAKGDKLIQDAAPPFALELNKALRNKDRSDMSKLFGTEEPLSVTWQVTATNLTTGKPVPVFMDDKPHAEGVRVQWQTALFKQDSATVSFLSPGTSGIVACKFVGTVRDNKGGNATVELSVWSHGIGELQSIEDLAAIVQAMAGLLDNSKMVAPQRKPSETDIVMSEKERKVLVMQAALHDAGRDRVVTVEELQTLLAAIKKF